MLLKITWSAHVYSESTLYISPQKCLNCWLSLLRELESLLTKEAAAIEIGAFQEVGSPRRS